MTRLRKMMLEELERRNYSEATTRCYIRTVEDFSRRFRRSPDGLGPEHIREYQAELFKKRKLSPGTVTQRLAALRFSPPEQNTPRTKDSSDLWLCPKCAGPMVVVERFTAAQMQLRSPPGGSAAA